MIFYMYAGSPASERQYDKIHAAETDANWVIQL